MTDQTYFFIAIPAILVFAVLALMYLNGNFSYTDHIIERNRYKVTKTNPFTGAESEEYVYRIVIRRD